MSDTVLDFEKDDLLRVHSACKVCSDANVGAIVRVDGVWESKRRLMQTTIIAHGSDYRGSRSVGDRWIVCYRCASLLALDQDQRNAVWLE